MKVFTNRWNEYSGEFSLENGTSRIAVTGTICLYDSTEVYFIRRKRLGTIWNYFWSEGPFQIAQKVLSRIRERERNIKCVNLGWGRIQEGELERECPVCFLAPHHPPCATEFVVPNAFICNSLGDFPNEVGCVLFLDLRNRNCLSKLLWRAFSGYQIQSGLQPPPIDFQVLAKSIKELLMIYSRDVRRLPFGPSTKNSRNKRTVTKGSNGAIIMGFGNYAKTQVLPVVKKYFRVSYIREVDPTQVPKNWFTKADVRAQSILGEVTGVRVAFLCGYHHTHAPNAIEALRQRIIPVLEKPPATTSEQLNELRRGIVKAGIPFYVCFNRRYAPYTRWSVNYFSQCVAVDYWAIVQEVRLPQRHWYRWPVSKSKVVSNACHWLDHFLFMNNYAEVRNASACVKDNENILLTVDLENDARGIICLTGKGSERIGMNESIEMRSGDITIKIHDFQSFVAENNRKILRRHRGFRRKGHREMYHAICRDIIVGGSGDTLRSLEISSKLMIELDNQVSLQSDVIL